MKRDDLIALILKKIPVNGNVCVENGNIDDEDIMVSKQRGKPGGEYSTEKAGYFLLEGKAGV